MFVSVCDLNSSQSSDKRTSSWLGFWRDSLSDRLTNQIMKYLNILNEIINISLMFLWMQILGTLIN